MGKRNACDAFGATEAQPVHLDLVKLKDFVENSGTPSAVDTENLQAEASGTVPALAPERLLAFQNAVRQRDAVCVLLAAGQGSRFKADFPKVVHPFDGKPLAQHGIDAARNSGIPVIVIIGHARKQVVDALNMPEGDQVVFVCQESQMGTGHAVFLAKYVLPDDFTGDIIVSYADNPGVDGVLLNQLLGSHLEQKTKHGDKYAAMILTGSRKCAGQGAASYGRIIRSTKEGGPVVDIVEKKTFMKLAEDKQEKSYEGVTWNAKEIEDVDEFNSGIVVARGQAYLDVLGDIVASQTKFHPPKYEYYATDFVKGLVSKGMVADGFKVPEDSMWKLEGANTLEELKELERKQTERRLKSQITDIN